ncbi:hypothetical protein V8J82_17010 [Gymnodinialimonas sp. 2305UL16-5]|uniref:hypothetical protein n=1 Tax=Gymnodinialimonas mytili TaxID=3126503 RepID=UPI0030B54208
MKPVRRRRVLYIPGYDPMPPRSYRERYRREAAKQAELSGYRVDLAPSGPNGWRVTAEVEGADVLAEIEVLPWADLVQTSMAGGIWQTYHRMLCTAWIYIGSGALFRLMRLRKGPVIAALYPVLVLFGQAALAVCIAVGVAFAIYRIGAWATASLDNPFDAFRPIAALAGFCAGWWVLRWCARRDHLLAWYLIRDYAFTAQERGAYPAALSDRLDQFRDRLARTMAEEVDEVLVVGHSSGAFLAVSVVADLLRRGPERSGPTLSLLTLGQVIPMLSFLPEAGRLRADLAAVSVSHRVDWVDISAPGDGCAFALCDPVSVTGLAGPAKRGPLVLSASFTQTLTAQTRDALKYRLFETHFQYLNAFDALPDRRDAYEYVRVTAGPMMLADRFATRAPSHSRIEQPVNRFTDIAA